MSWLSRHPIAVLALSALLAGCNGLSPTSEPNGVARGKSAPDAVGEDAEGHALKLADFRGRVVMLSFWSIH
jgi:hypothetical protein